MSTAAQGLGHDPLTDPPDPVSTINLANALTLFRVLLVPLFAALLMAGDGDSTSLRVAAWGVFALACWTDRIDGQIARNRGLVTAFGKLLDPIADKALVGTALVGLSLLGELAWWITGLVLAREVGVTLLRFWVIRHGVIPASRGGKLKAFVQAVAIGLYVLPLTGLLATGRAGVMGLAIIITVATGLDYVFRALHLRRTSARADMKRARKARAHR